MTITILHSSYTYFVHIFLVSSDKYIKFHKLSSIHVFYLLTTWLYNQVVYNPKEISFYKQHAQAGRICLLGGVKHAQHRTKTPLSIDDCCQGDGVHRRLLPRRWCTNHGPVRDVLARRTSRLNYTLFVKGTLVDYRYSNSWSPAEEV